MNEKKIQKLLNIDPLYEAEKLTGKSYKSNKETEALGFSILQQTSLKKKKALLANEDTTLSNEVDKYLEITQKLGFEIVLKESFKSKEKITDFIYILFHYDYSILLKFDTYTWGDDGSWINGPPPPVVNSSSIYYNWSQNNNSHKFGITSSGHFLGSQNPLIYTRIFNDNLKEVFYSPKHLLIEKNGKMDSHLPTQQDLDNFFLKNHEKYRTIWIGDHDAREGLKHKITRLSKNGKFVKYWYERPFLWLVHHGDKDCDKDTNYKRINEKRIKKLPIEVQKRITPCH